MASSAILVSVGVVLAGQSGSAQTLPMEPFPASVDFVTELSDDARVVEIVCPTCPGRTSFALRLNGADAPKPVEGQRVRVFCQSDLDGVMRLVTVDWTPEGA